MRKQGRSFFTQEEEEEEEEEGRGGGAWLYALTFRFDDRSLSIAISLLSFRARKCCPRWILSCM